MYHKEPEITQVLAKGRQILSASPDLKTLSVDQLLDTLDDGTQEMLHNRWGAAACLCADRIEDYSYAGVVRALSSYENVGFLCTYTAYILQREHNISMVRLLIEAGRQGLAQQIVPFVSNNLSFEEAARTEEVMDFLKVVCGLPDDKKVYLLRNYADLITSKSLTDTVVQILFDNRLKEAAEFMPHLCQSTYQKDYAAGERLLGELMDRLDGDAFFVDAVLEGLYLSTYQGVQLFEQYFPAIQVLQQEHTHWKRLIPVFVNDIEQKNQDPAIKAQVLADLGKISAGTAEEKRIFLNAIAYRKSPASELVKLRHTILENSFEKDPGMLEAVQTYFYMQRKKVDAGEMLRQLRRIFIANEYGLGDYKDFFQAFAVIWSAEKDDQAAIWRAFLRSMFTEGIGDFTFALGLYENVLATGSLSSAASETEVQLPLLILLIQLITYYTVDAKRVCKFAFEMASLVRENEGTEYIKAYMDDVYLNYHHSSQEIAKTYAASQHPVQAKLAERIIARYEAEEALQDRAWEILDLRPSEERSRIYRKVQSEQNTKINKLANEKSIFAHLFPRQVMKYGKRTAHVQTMRQGKQAYSVQPYAVFERGFELPALHVEDPLEWAERRYQFLQKRSEYIASDHQRLPFAVEREG